MKAEDVRLNESISSTLTHFSSQKTSKSFIEPRDISTIISTYDAVRNDAEKRSKKILFRLGFANKELKSNVKRILALDYNSAILNHNHDLALTLADSISAGINPLEGRDLDRQQLAAIACDVKTRLIIAGAGTGKTTTTIGLVKELLLFGKAGPEDILALSFTNASVNELRQRIQAETGERIEVSTFHRLGLKIISAAGGKVPRITKTDINNFVESELKNRNTDPEYLDALNEFFSLDFDMTEDENRFADAAEYLDYIRKNPLVTLNGERVKSYGEGDIADCLARNGVPYIYEDPYKIDTRTSRYGQYCPDFHISGTDIYIEYFGTDREGNVAPFMVDSNPRAAEDYKEGIEWKRRLHRENGTDLIELYAYNRSEHDLIPRLEAELRKRNIELRRADPEELLEKTLSHMMSKVSSLCSVISTAILLVKGYNKPWDEVYPRSQEHGLSAQLARFEKVLKPLYDAYLGKLAENDEIDFEDMLNLAAGIIREGGYVPAYKYVIVDEYQDLSRSRYNLLKAMRDADDFSLFCVGDDWQSIYRFNGCDVSYILDFEKYWGPSEVCRIENTYRFSGELLEKSSEFICRNPRQYRKKLVGMRSGNSRILPIFGPDYTDIRRRIARKLMEIPEGKSILFLGRYNHDVNILSADGFSWRQDISSNSATVRYRDLPGKEMKFMTIHSSKGLQADYVFSLNNNAGAFGFPAQRQEPPVISMLLGGGNQYDEERRLFYVAVTRARDTAYVVSQTGNMSVFFKEMFPLEKDARVTDLPMVCPICGGMLVERSGTYGRFYGCSNFASRGCKYTRQPNK